jgi:hypothetical protein
VHPTEKVSAIPPIPILYRDIKNREDSRLISASSQAHSNKSPFSFHARLKWGCLTTKTASFHHGLLAHKYDTDFQRDFQREIITATLKRYEIVMNIK